MRGTSPASCCTSSWTAGSISIFPTRSSARRASLMPGRSGSHERLLVDAVRVRAGDVHRAGGDPPGVAPVVHAAHVAHQRDFGDCRGGVDRGRRGRLSVDDSHHRCGGAVRLHDQHRQRVSDHGPHAQDVQEAMIHAIAEAAAVLATALFIFSLHWMNDPKTARHGVVAGVTGMVIAVGATWIQPEILHHGWIVLAIVAGFIVGVPLSLVPLTAVPQRTALSHAFGGLAAGLVGTAEYFLGLGENPAQLTAFRMSAIVAEVILGFLTIIMCRAMNRSFANVLFGAFGTVQQRVALGEQKAWKQETVEGAAQLLEQASLVVVIPGYGMAVAQAQHKVRELYDQLTKRGITVKFAIHPVAGRMPGHMNVLLAEADIPYTALVEMEEINPEMPQCDVALVIGANDVVNPAARYAKGSPIYGMPIIDADKAKTVLAIKRSKNPGFAGIDNELYVQDNTWMLFGDAKAVIGELVKQLAGGGLH